MEQAPPPTPPTAQPTDQQPQPQPPPAPPTQQPPQPPPSSSSSSPIPPLSSSLLSSSSPNPNPTPKPPIAATPSPPQTQQTHQNQQQPTIQNPQTRPPFVRPWQTPSHFSHFTTSSPPVPPFSTPAAAAASSSASSPSQRGGGMAIGVPAHHPTPPSPPFPTAFGQPFAGLGRNVVNVSDSVPSSSTSQVRQPVQIGMMGSLGSSSAMRPGGVSAHQLRSVQSSVRPQSGPNSQPPATPNFQGHGMLRGSSVGSSASQSPSASQGAQPLNQPWLSSGSQGKPPLPPPSLRPQMTPQSLQQRSHITQHPMPTTQQQQSSPGQQQQQSQPSQQAQDHYMQSFPPSRAQSSLSHQQQISRVQGLGYQKSSSVAIMQPSTQPGPLRTASAETGETSDRILTKRSIQELVTQIDPLERLDPEVEDILMDIADEFVESITTFGCSLAKHRKSSTLEAKDILLHLERNWNLTLPGFGADEIKGYRKPFASDIHRERLAAIKRSVLAAETANNAKSSAGQAGGTAKGHLMKAATNVIGSPNSKVREAA